MTHRSDRPVALALLVAALSPACSTGPAPGAATVYEDFYVPALFGPWAERVLDAAAIREGDRVLDVACGTGIVARGAARKAGPSGKVVGLDIDPAMLQVAREVAPALEWVEGDAQALPFPDESFDVVTCQFGLMFFPDQQKSIREMQRVAAPGGRIVVAVWDELDKSPGYARLVALVEKHMGAEVADLIRTPFRSGDREALARLFADAGAAGARTTTLTGIARFPSIRSWVETEVRGWVGLTKEIDEAKLAQLLEAAEADLAAFTDNEGQVRIPIQAHLVGWVRQ